MKIRELEGPIRLIQNDKKSLEDMSVNIRKMMFICGKPGLFYMIIILVHRVVHNVNLDFIHTV
jgi:hypothetical protein